jgi:hypothetical protein
MKNRTSKIDIKGALHLRSMNVMAMGKRVITIDRPSAEFERMAVDITESMDGIRRRFGACRFYGYVIRWHLN